VLSGSGIDADCELSGAAELAPLELLDFDELLLVKDIATTTAVMDTATTMIVK
jgi:hypothetical protein